MNIIQHKQHILHIFLLVALTSIQTACAEKPMCDNNNLYDDSKALTQQEKSQRQEDVSQWLTQWKDGWDVKEKKEIDGKTVYVVTRDSFYRSRGVNPDAPPPKAMPGESKNEDPIKKENLSDYQGPDGTFSIIEPNFSPFINGTKLPSRVDSVEKYLSYTQNHEELSSCH